MYTRIHMGPFIMLTVFPGDVHVEYIHGYRND